MEADPHRHAMRSRRPREVEHLARDELAVRHEDGVPVLGDDARGPPADLEDPTHPAADLDPLAAAERAVELQTEPAEDVGDGRLEREPDDCRQHRRGRDEREEVEARKAEKAHDESDRHRHQQEVTQDRRHIHPDACQHEVEDHEPGDRDQPDAEREDAEHLHQSTQRRTGHAAEENRGGRQHDGHAEEQHRASAAMTASAWEEPPQDGHCQQGERRHTQDHPPGAGILQAVRDGRHWVQMPRFRSRLRRFPAADEGIEPELTLRRAGVDREPVAPRGEGERDDHAPAENPRSGRQDGGREPVVDEHLGGAVGRDLEREGGGPIHLLEAREGDAGRRLAEAPPVDVSLQRALPPGAARVAR